MLTLLNYTKIGILSFRQRSIIDYLVKNMGNNEIIAEIDKKTDFLSWKNRVITDGMIAGLDVELRIALDKARAEGLISRRTKTGEQAVHSRSTEAYQFEKGRQSAQKEIEDLKNMLNSAENDLELAEDRLKNNLSEKQEQVRKLIVAIEEDRHLTLATTNLSPEFKEMQDIVHEYVNKIYDEVKKIIKKNFPDCAENKKDCSVCMSEAAQELFGECQEGKFCAKHGMTHIKEEVIK